MARQTSRMSTSDRGPVALFDWDGTLHRGQTVQPWVHFLRDRGVFSPECSESLDREFAEYDGSIAGYEPFVARALALYAAGLRGQSATTVASLAREFVRQDLENVFAFVDPLLSRLDEAGVAPILISGSPIEVIEAFADAVGIDQVHATVLEVVDDLYTGRVEAETASGAAKTALTAEYVDRPIAVAGGDSIADLPMLEAARSRLVVGGGVPLRADRRTLVVDPEAADLRPLARFLDAQLAPWELGVA